MKTEKKTEKKEQKDFKANLPSGDLPTPEQVKMAFEASRGMITESNVARIILVDDGETTSTVIYGKHKDTVMLIINEMEQDENFADIIEEAMIHFVIRKNLGGSNE